MFRRVRNRLRGLSAQDVPREIPNDDDNTRYWENIPAVYYVPPKKGERIGSASFYCGGDKVELPVGEIGFSFARSVTYHPQLDDKPQIIARFRSGFVSYYPRNKFMRIHEEDREE